MRQYLLPEKGQFYKANMHAHTNISDGQNSPEEVKQIFRDMGYSIVAYTEHEVLVPHNDLTDENFLAITSYEVSLNDYWPTDFQFQKTYHLNLYAKDRYTSVSSVFSEKNFWIDHSLDYISEECRKIKYTRHYTTEGVNDLIKKANDDGFLVCLNHPVWSVQRYPDYAGLKGLWGVEVYNGCDQGGFIENTQAFDDLLHLNEKVYPIAADDSHSKDGSGRGWIQVKAENLEYDTIMEALERGDFYASTAPEIHEFYIEDGVVHASTSDAVQIRLLTERRCAWAVNGTEEKPVNECAFDLNQYIKDTRNNPNLRCRPWFRLEVSDRTGKAAQTRAYYLDELNLL